MIHRLTIDRRRCRGLLLCHACEAIQPGLHDACRADGQVLIQPWANRDCSSIISALVRCCPDRAIVVSPNEPPP